MYVINSMEEINRNLTDPGPAAWHWGQCTASMRSHGKPPKNVLWNVKYTPLPPTKPLRQFFLPEYRVVYRIKKSIEGQIKNSFSFVAKHNKQNFYLSYAGIQLLLQLFVQFLARLQISRAIFLIRLVRLWGMIKQWPHVAIHLSIEMHRHDSGNCKDFFQYSTQITHNFCFVLKIPGIEKKREIFFQLLCARWFSLKMLSANGKV